MNCKSTQIRPVPSTDARMWSFVKFCKTQMKLTKKEIIKKSKEEHGGLEPAAQLYEEI